MVVIADLGRGWPKAERAALGTSWVLKQQLCPGKLQCSVRQTQEYDSFMQLKIILKDACYGVTGVARV